MRTVDPKLTEERRASILEATCRLVAEHGYHQVRVKDIAELCGTSTGTIHYYFPGKGDVLREALRFSVDRAFARQAARLRPISEARERLAALIDMQTPASDELRDEWSIWLQVWTEATIDPTLRPLHEEFYQRWHETVRRIVLTGQREGSLAPGVDADAFALLLTSLVDGLAIKVLTGAGGLTPEGMRSTLLGVVARELAEP